MKDKRELQRFELRLPAKIRSLDPEQNLVERRKGASQILFTKDISAGGAFFLSPKPFSQGSRVEVHIGLSLGAANGLENRTKVIVKGNVLRSDPTGMAIRFNTDYKIIEPPKKISSRRPELRDL